MRTLLPLLTIFSLLTFTACSNKGDANAVLSADDMEDVLFDYHLAQSLVNQSGDSADFRIRVYAEAVFKKHEVTEEQFNTSLRYYHRHTTELHDIYKNIEKRMNFLVGDYSETRYTSEGDTANIWQGPERYLLSAALGNYITFSQPTDTLCFPLSLSPEFTPLSFTTSDLLFQLFSSLPVFLLHPSITSFLR
jgi:hypothetical protein